MEKLVVTPEEAAEMLVTSPATVRGWIREGLLPAYRQGRNWKIVISQLQIFIEQLAIHETERRKQCQESSEQHLEP